MEHSVALRRLGYRFAYRLLALVWALVRIRPDGVKCLITDGERLLLVRHSYGPGGWDLPGGAHRRAESPEQTASREMSEELDLPPRDWHDLGTLTSHRGSHHIHVLTTDAPGFRPRPDPIELVDAAWFPRTRLPPEQAPLLPRVLHALEAHEPGDPPLTPTRSSPEASR